jgi:hypothetical protein
MMTQKILKKFLKLAVEQLHGEWIVIGGTVLPLCGIDFRVTTDIDFVKLDFKSSNNETLKLMEIAETLKLPVESINQAGAFFLSKIDHIEENLILLEESKKCKIFRPNIYLFIKLKIERLSSTDLEDCIQMIKHHPEEFELFKDKIIKTIKQKLKIKSPSQEKGQRLQKLYELCSN